MKYLDRRIQIFTFINDKVELDNLTPEERLSLGIYFTIWLFLRETDKDLFKLPRNQYKRFYKLVLKILRKGVK